ncbi:recombinase RecA [Xylanimonas allomyrinae]|uniref:Protein RecA n=1 Tax=Xylanimonas allomyrinae TaxID=2509459 RepID=A0A4P6EPW2_9MICO|nr:recombinase RecA [Xylanimonas allomyrinae]
MPAPADRDKALEAALAQIDRSFGKGSVMRLGDDSRAPVEVIPTGSIALDVALGIGGLPRGRVVEIYGPESSGKTTVALHAVASAQRSGGIAAFIDAEHALDPEYAKKLGVDTDALLVSQPDTGEQALEIADMLIRSGALDVIVIDSVAALVPKAEIEGEMGDSHVGLQARLMSQALRKITGALSSSGTTAIFINQLREKIGVFFGCFDYSTRVVLADGTTEQIGTIVDEKRPVEVLSYDPESGQAVPRKVVNWFDNGPAERFLEFTVESGTGEGAQFAATENHLVRTPGGWREAGEILAGDRVMVAEDALLSDQQWQVVLGGLLGGATLSSLPGGRAQFRMDHSPAQAAYLGWKASMLHNVGQTRTVLPDGATQVGLRPLAELSELREVVDFGDGKKHITEDYLKALTPLALAVWYMDRFSVDVMSGCPQASTGGSVGHAEVCVDEMSPGSRERLAGYLRDSHGVDCALHRQDSGQQWVIRLTQAGTARLQEVVAPYVHASMQHLLDPRFRGQFDVTPEVVAPRTVLMPARVSDVRVKPKAPSMRRFDIEVEGNHNYFVDGVMVHNSPETTTGGKALKFYASVRLDIRRIETLKEGTEPVGNRTRVKVVKNKMAPPFKQAEFDILYGVGISREGGLIDMGVEHGLVRKSGSWFTYEGDQLGQGKENARGFLRDNPDLANELEKRIKEKLGVGAKLDAPADDVAAGKAGTATPAAAAAPAAGAKGKKAPF